jgi:hypothetical protein
MINSHFLYADTFRFANYSTFPALGAVTLIEPDSKK